MSRKKLLHVNEEDYFIPFGSGVKLFTEKQLSANFLEMASPNRVSDLMQMPHCIYFSNLRSETQLINHTALSVCGYASLKDAIGKTIEYVATTETARSVISSHQLAISKNTLNIVEDEVIRKDDGYFQSLSIIKPWYDNYDEIIGIFGCSILLDNCQLSSCLSEIVNKGLFAVQNHLYKAKIPGTIVNGVYLSKREAECLHFYVQGFTAKIIATKLNLSYRTVEFYINNIKNKFGVNTKSELISLVLEANIP